MFLERILDAKRAEIAARRATTPGHALRAVISRLGTPRDFRGAIAKPGLSIIAEVKRASPSKGGLSPDLSAAGLAGKYEAGGCAAVSVLTDRSHFGARPGDLQDVRAAVSVPVLRKDFLIDEYQLLESRAMGADAVLLIVAALGPEQLPRMIAEAERLDLCALVEAHTEEEMRIALDCGARLVGVNNRDLRTFEVDLETTARIAPMVPRSIPLVCERGIRSESDAKTAASWGVDAVLIGEALVTSPDPAGLLRDFCRAGSQAPPQPAGVDGLASMPGLRPS